MPKHLDLFSGIGGFALAASWVWGSEHQIHSFVEIDPFCQKVLKKHWPAVPIHSDIKTYKHDGTTIDILTGGFPCQPFSLAGKRRGAEDDRALWPQMLRIIRECRPHWIIGENVAGIINMELDTVLTQLENEDYTTEAFIIPACAVDAPHRRDRIWIMADTTRNLLDGCRHARPRRRFEPTNGNKTVADTELFRPSQHEKQAARFEQQGFKTGRNIQANWPTEPDVGRVANGIPGRVDRLKSLGNAIVPQVVRPIMEAIKELDSFGYTSEYIPNPHPTQLQLY